MKRDVLIAGLFALIWAGAVLFLNLGQWKIDTTALYFASKSFGAGMSDVVYAPGPKTYLVDPPAQWVTWAGEDGWEEVFFTPYLYPPLWAALLAPVTAVVSSKVFFDAALILNIAATLAMVWLGWRLMRPQRLGVQSWTALALGILFISAVGYTSFWLGQPQVLVAAITLAAFVALAEGRDVTAGGALALAAAMKLSPVLLVVIFIMEKRWKALGAFAVIGAALGGLSIGLVGWPLHAEMLDKLALIEERVLVSRILVGLELPLYQLGEFIAGRANWIIGNPYQVMEPLWVTWTVRGALVLGLLITWWETRNVSTRLRIWMRLMAVLMVTLLTNPLGWLHYLILPFVLLPGLYEIMEKRAATIVISFIALSLSMPAFLALGSIPAMDFVQVALNITIALGLLIVILRRARAEANP